MSHDNVRIVQAVYEARKRGDLAALLSHLDPELVGYESDALPYAGVYRGPEGFVQHFQKVTALFRLDLHVEELTGTADRVIARVQGQFVPKAGGAPISVDIAEHWTLRHHKVLEVRPYYWNPKPLAEHATQSSRDHYAALVAKYFEYAHSNRLEEVVAMFTDDAFATFMVAPDTFYGKKAIRGFCAQLFQDFPTSSPRSSRSRSRATARSPSSG